MIALRVVGQPAPSGSMLDPAEMIAVWSDVDYFAKLGSGSMLDPAEMIAPHSVAPTNP